MRTGDKVEFLSNGGFAWSEPISLFYGVMVDEDHLFIHRKSTGEKARPLGVLEPKGGWRFYESEIKIV